jgi:hypothetical protein
VKKFLIASLLSLSVVSPALAGEKTSFTHDGVKYTYSVTDLGENKRVITGHATPGAQFRLVVWNDKVSGTANGIPVAFKVSDARGVVAASKAPTIVAAR